MITLALDTALTSCSIALSRDGKILSRFSRPMARGHAEVLVPYLLDTLKSADLTAQNIDNVLATTGPGSFTGIRVGIATVLGLTLSYPLQSAGVTTFEATAYAAGASLDSQKTSLILAVIDSLQQDFYYQFFDQELRPLSEPALGSSDVIRKEVEARQAESTASLSVVGSGVDRLRESAPALKATFDNQASINYAEILCKMAASDSFDWQGRPCRPFYLKAPGITLSAKTPSHQPGQR